MSLLKISTESTFYKQESKNKNTKDRNTVEEIKNETIKTENKDK